MNIHERLFYIIEVCLYTREILLACKPHVTREGVTEEAELTIGFDDFDHGSFYVGSYNKNRCPAVMLSDLDGIPYKLEVHRSLA